jgi:hypothetical protein
MRPQRVALVPEDPVLERARAERRRFRRVRVDLPGRLFVPADNLEAVCKIVEMSPGGASVECEVIPAVATQIILYVDGLGRFEGAIARVNPQGFGARFSSTQLKRERTAEQLTLLMNKTLVDESDLRREERVPAKALTRFTRSDGSTVNCEVLDLSTSGISLKTDIKLRPQVGEFVLIGKMAGRVVRHHNQGVGIEFVGLGPERPTTDFIHASILVR